MARTAEQVLRDIVAEQVFKIAQLIAEVERLTEENQKLVAEAKQQTV